MELKVMKPFDWAHKGVRVESFEKGQVINTEDEDLIRVSIDEKWCSRVKGAPENRNLGDAGENKEQGAESGQQHNQDGQDSQARLEA